jgi:hypothetical protein
MVDESVKVVDTTWVRAGWGGEYRWANRCKSRFLGAETEASARE